MFTQKQFPVLFNIEISETRKTYLIKADIRGFHAETVEVTPAKDTLIVKMETRHEPGQSYYLGQLEPEYYQRVIPLGFNISDEQFYTKHNSGILSIHINKPTTAKSLASDSLGIRDSARAVA